MFAKLDRDILDSARHSMVGGGEQRLLQETSEVTSICGGIL
jgi:hypothetical protein